MRKLILSLAVAAVGFSWGALARAEEAVEHKPVLVVSLSGYSELLADIDYIGALSDKENTAQTLEAMLKLFTANKGLAGLDKDRPWGLAVTSTGDQMPNFGFLPVTDLEALLDALVAFVGDPEKGEDGIWELEVQRIPVYVKEKNGWAYIAMNPTSLEDLPEDAGPLLGGLEKTYDLAVQANPQNIPAHFRDALISQLKKFVEFGMSQPNKGETEEEHAQRQKLAQTAIEQMEQVVNDLESLTIGYSTNREDRRLQLDFSLAAVPGSKLAGQMALLSEPVKTKFAGFMRPDAVVSLRAAQAKVDADEAEQAQAVLKGMVEQINAQIDANVSPEHRAKVHALVDSAINLAVANTKDGKSDMALSMIGEGPFTILSGGHIADAKAGQDFAASLLGLADGAEGFSDVKRDIAKHKGVTFHSVTMTISEDCCKPPAAAIGQDHRIQLVQAQPNKKKPKKEALPKARPQPGEEQDPAEQQRQMMEALHRMAMFTRECLGEKVPLLVGVGDGKLLFGAGENALDELKKSIDQSEANRGQVSQGFELSVQPWPFIKQASKANPDNGGLSMLAHSEAANSPDHIRVLAVPGENALTYRLEFEEGVIKLFGLLGALAPAPPGF